MTSRAVVTAAPCSPSLAAALQTVCVSLRPLSPPTVGIVTFLQPSYPGPQPLTTPSPGINWNKYFFIRYIVKIVKMVMFVKVVKVMRICKKKVVKVFTVGEGCKGCLCMSVKW